MAIQAPPGRPAPFLIAGLAAVLLAAACGKANERAASPPVGPAASPADVWFAEEAAIRGVVFRHVSGFRDGYLFPEIMGGGVALFDMEGDGDLDLYLVQSGAVLAPREERPGNQLYRNRGDGTFEDVSAGSGAEDRGYGMGVATGDYDADGDVDLYVTNLDRDTLLENDGTGHFTDVTQRAGVGNPAWGTSAAFLDYDLDGRLDIFVTNYVGWSEAAEQVCESPPLGPDYCAPMVYRAPTPDVLYHNEGDGTFRDVSAAAGLRTAFGNGLGVISSDFDADGWPDIFVANDRMVNQLWVNQSDGTFRDRALPAGVAVDDEGNAKGSMGVAAADLDFDGDEDLLVVNFDRESDSFHRNEGKVFSDRTGRVGLGMTSRSFTRFGCALVDFDDDGLLDLYQADGRVLRPASFTGDDPYAEENLLYRGTDEGRFAEVVPRGGTARPLVATSRGTAFGDIDNDGGLDIVVVNRDAPVHLLRNVRAGRGGWVSLAVSEGRGAFAIGAVVTGRAGERRIMRCVRTAYSYCAANDPRIHVGLGAAPALEEVAVRWPDGILEHFRAVPAGTAVRLVRGGGQVGPK
ncbi:MAG: CRTAC1 family protein [Planctomycetota bacterium]